MTAPAKSCGDCGLCCKLMGVEEIAKPPLAWCREFKRGCGCRTYETRPKACADFICYWLHLPVLDESWRPDRAGFVMHMSEQGRRLNIEVDPAQSAGWRREPYLSTLRGWAAAGLDRGLELVVWRGRTATKLTQTGEIDLGVRRPQAPRGPRPARRASTGPSARV